MPKLSKADKVAKVSATEARRSKEEALARLRWLEVAKAEATVFDAAAVRSELAAMHKQIRDGFLRLPDKLARQLAAASDPRECRDMMAGEVKAILANLSNELRLTR